MDTDAQHYVEDFGILFEELGGGRMVGRILGYLTIADPPQQSAENIANALKASRGAVSQATRVLIQLGMVRRVNRPGERRDYFALKPEAWTEASRNRVGEIDRLIAIFERGQRLTEHSPPQTRHQFDETLAFLRFWRRSFTEMFDRWQVENPTHDDTIQRHSDA